MTVNDERVIELSKTKVSLLLVGALAFVALGVWILAMDSVNIEEQSHRNPIFARGVGIAAILFFGLCGAAAARKLIETKPGLILNSQGIVDNSSGVSAGPIPWSEISGFKVFEIHRQKLLVVLLVNPEKYVAVGGSIKQSLSRANLKLCGSPIALSANALQIGFDELVALLEDYYGRYGTR